MHCASSALCARSGLRRPLTYQTLPELREAFVKRRANRPSVDVQTTLQNLNAKATRAEDFMS